MLFFIRLFVSEISLFSDLRPLLIFVLAKISHWFWAAVGAAIGVRAYGGISPPRDILVCKGIPLTSFHDVTQITTAQI